MHSTGIIEKLEKRFMEAIKQESLPYVVL